MLKGTRKKEPLTWQEQEKVNVKIFCNNSKTMRESSVKNRIFGLDWAKEGVLEVC